MSNFLSSVTEQHDWRLLLLAIGTSLLANCVAVYVFRCAQRTSGRKTLASLVAAAIAMGCGISAVHYIATFAYQPAVPISSNLWLSVFSFLIGVALTGIGLGISLNWRARWGAIFGGAFVGAGIAGAHSTAIWAFSTSANLTWNPIVIVASIVLGIAFGIGAVTLVSRYDGRLSAIVAALLLTLAVVAHHFVAINAIEFASSGLSDLDDPFAYSRGVFLLAAIISLIVGASLATAIIDWRFRQENRLLATAINNMSHGLTMFDRNARLVVSNQKYLDFYGMSSDIVKPGCSYFDLIRHRKELGIVAGDAETYARQALTRMRAGQPWTILHKLPDGREILAVQRPTPDGGWVSTHEDVTERNRFEVSLREQKLQLDTAVSNMTQGLLMFDADERLVLWNERYIQMFGLSEDVVKLGCSYLDLMKHRKEAGGLSGELDDYLQQRRVRLAEGEPWSVVHELADGRHIQSMVRPMPNGGWVSTHEDVTERNRFEGSLQEQKLQLDAALNNMTQGLVMFDAEERLALWNDRYIQIFSLSPEIVKLGCPLFELITHRKRVGAFAGNPEEFCRQIRLRVTARQPWSVVHELPDGRSIQSTIDPMPNGGWVATFNDITERKRIEASLSEQKLQLDTAVKNMTEGLVMFNSDAEVVLCNDRYITMYGLSPNVVKLGCSHIELLRHRKEMGNFKGDPESSSRIRRARVVEGKPFSVVHELADGRIIQSGVSPMPNGGWVSTHNDITERSHFETILQEQKFQLDTAVNNMSQGLVMFNAEAEVVLCNDRYIEMYGLSPGIVKLGCSHLELIRHRKDAGVFSGNAEAYSRQHRSRVAAGQPWSIIHELADGRSIQRILRPMPDGGWVSTHEDITERKRVEASLQEQKLQLDTAVNNMSQGLVMFNAEAEVVLCNDRYIEMYGLSPGIVRLGCSQIELLRHRKDVGVLSREPDEYLRRHRERMAAGHPWAIEHNLADGRNIQVILTPMPNGGWVSTHEDITERKRVEASLQEQKLQLDTAVNNMTQGLVMFNADARMVLCNDRYIEMFGLSPDVVKVGCSHVDLMRHRIATGVFQGSLEDYIALHSTRLETGKPSSIVHELVDGRSIQSMLRPMPNGGWVSTHDDITERLQTQRRIEHLAHHDALTGLPNRAAFNGFIAGALRDAERRGRKLAVMCIDLDRFKTINDVFGHAIGDALLRKVADRLTTVADGAFVARLGGDEFSIVVTQGRQPEVTEELIGRLHAAMVDAIDVGDHSLLTAVSIGVAVYPNDGSDSATLLANSDAALYRAKRDGRGGACFFDADMDRELRERRLLQHELRLAFESGTLELAYQPQARVSGEVIGFEALARWSHQEHGQVDPEVFIRLAEDSGLIIQLGEWILRQACAEAASWRHELHVAVNLSPVQFSHGDLPTLVSSVLVETGLAPGRLELEVTEGVLGADFDRASSILGRLKALGVRISIDDFGKGYSSLSYLLSFPFDKIKIDRGFVARLDGNPQARAIVRAVIELAHGLSLPVLAEGVETEKQLAFLENEACDEIQGFLIGRPHSIDRYAEVVGKSGHVRRSESLEAV